MILGVNGGAFIGKLGTADPAVGCAVETDGVSGAVPCITSVL